MRPESLMRVLSGFVSGSAFLAGVSGLRGDSACLVSLGWSYVPRY